MIELESGIHSLKRIRTVSILRQPPQLARARAHARAHTHTQSIAEWAFKLRGRVPQSDRTSRNLSVQCHLDPHSLFGHHTKNVHSAVVWMRHIKKLPRSIYGALQSGIYLVGLTRIVEELVLNGIDAGSTKIHVSVDFTSCIVKVEDNGRGISRNDLELLGERYATCKLYNLYDIDAGDETLGFRGETLSSLSDISLLEVITKACGMPNGYRKVIKGGKCLCIEIDNHRQEVGTTVICREIFHNHPVRRKYLLSRPKKVLDLIKKSVLYIALVQPHISFEIFDLHSEKVLLSTYSSPSPLSLVATYFGADASSTLNQVNFSNGELKLFGYLSASVLGFSTKAFQFFYINTRLVSESPIHDLINELAADFRFHWRSKHTGRGKLKDSSVLADPRYILNLSCPISIYKLTFEPSKTTVEFKDWTSILSFIEISVRNSWRDLPDHLLRGLAHKDNPPGVEETLKGANSLILEKGHLDSLEVERKIRGKMQHLRHVHSSRSKNSAKCHIAHGKHQSRIQQENDCLWGTDARLLSKDAVPTCQDAALGWVDEYEDGHLLGLKWGSGSTIGDLDPTDRLRGNRNENSDCGFLNGEILLRSRESKKLKFMMDASSEPESYSNSKECERLFVETMTTTNGFAVDCTEETLDHFGKEILQGYNPLYHVAPNVTKSCLNSKTRIFQDNFMDFEPSSGRSSTKRIHCLDALPLYRLEEGTFFESTEAKFFLSSLCSDGEELKTIDYRLKCEPHYKSCLDGVDDQLEHVVGNYELEQITSDEDWLSSSSGTGTKLVKKSYQKENEVGHRSYINRGYDQLEHVKGNYNLAQSTSNEDWSLSSSSTEAKLETQKRLYSGSCRESFRENELVRKSHFSPQKFNIDKIKSNIEWLNCNHEVKAESTPLYHIEVPVGNDCKSQSDNHHKFRHRNHEDFHCSPGLRARRCSSAPPYYRGKPKFSVILTNPPAINTGRDDLVFVHDFPILPASSRRKSPPSTHDTLEKALPVTLSTYRPHFRKCTENKHPMNVNQMQKSRSVEHVHPSDTIRGDGPTKWRNEPESKWGPVDNDIVIESKDNSIVGHLNGILDISSGVLHLSGSQLIPESISKDYLEGAKVLQQLDRKYIPITDGGVLAIVDQHAADERIRLEELRQNVLLGEGKSVSYLEYGKELVLPEVGFQLLQNYADQIRHWGWICDTHDENMSSFTRNLNLLHQQTINVTLLAVPCILGVNLSEKDLLEFLDQLDDTDGSVTMPPAVVRLLNYKACRGAIMFGDSLLPSECSLIVDELKQASLCFQCAHGRPTTAPLVNLEALHEQLKELNSTTDSWHGLRHHAPSLNRAEMRLASSSARI